MAQKVHIVLIDDIDQSDAEETVTFGLDGKEYAIDLNTKNARSLRDALAPYVAHARPVSGRGGRRRTRPPAVPLPPRSAPGRARTASTSPSAAASPPRSARRTPPPTDSTHTGAVTVADAPVSLPAVKLADPTSL